MSPRSNESSSPEGELEYEPSLLLQVSLRRDRLAWARVSDLATVLPAQPHFHIQIITQGIPHVHSNIQSIQTPSRLKNRPKI